MFERASTAIAQADLLLSIGTSGVVGIDWRAGSGELGYGISPRYWGQGYFKEALRLALRHLFEEAGLHRLWVNTQCDNAASIKGGA